MSETDPGPVPEEAPVCNERSAFRMERWGTTPSPELFSALCTLPAGHSGNHESVNNLGRYTWPALDRLAVVVTIENRFGGVMDRWTQLEGAGVVRPIDIEALVGDFNEAITGADAPPTIAVAVVRESDL